MPNKKDKNKSGISVYVPSEIKEALKSEAERQNRPMSEFVTDIYREKLENLGYDFSGKEAHRNA